MKLSKFGLYLNDPLWVLSQMAMLLRRTIVNIFFDGIEPSYQHDLLMLQNSIEQYSEGTNFNFNGLIIPQTKISPDMYYNIIFPYLYLYAKNENYRNLYSKEKRKYNSLSFYNDNIFHLTRGKGMLAHGAPYYMLGCRVKKGDTVLDLGADPGDFSAFACFCGAEKVIAFDPDKSQQLHKTIALYPKIFSAPFYVDYMSRGELTRSIDDFVRENDLKVDFIKMDIEGFEFRALRGARYVIQKDKPRLAICTYHRFLDRIKFNLYIKMLRPDYKIHTNNAILYAW